MYDLDAARAHAIYTRYVDAFWRGGGLYSGFAEWRDGRDAADVDSGPIFDGVGATASTFGVATTLAFGDNERRRRLLRQLPLGRRLVEENDGARIAGLDVDATWVTGSLMGDATLSYAITWRALPTRGGDD